MAEISLRSWSSAIAALTAIAILIACTGDSPNLVPSEDEDDGAASDPQRDGSDATTDASLDDAPGADDASDGSDGNMCKETPAVCRDPMQLCANQCKQTYNEQIAICQQDPVNLQACVNQRKAELAQCQTPCKSDCVTCANANGSCTGTPDCGKIAYVP